MLGVEFRNWERGSYICKVVQFEEWTGIDWVSMGEPGVDGNGRLAFLELGIH